MQNYKPERKRKATIFSPATATKSAKKTVFGAAQFCSFLSDTIEVEHFLVIPAISSLRRIPYKIPSQQKLDLFKTATDEGYHAEQSLAYLTELSVEAEST